MANEMEHLTSGQIAKLVNINKETLRFYEKKGLLPKPKRTEGGYKIYDNNTIYRLKFISNAKELGFTLTEIEELLYLRTDSINNCDDVRELAEKKINELERKMENIKKMTLALKNLSRNCSNDNYNDECPILVELENINLS